MIGYWSEAWNEAWNGPWTEFVIAYAVFLAAHRIPMMPRLKGAAQAVLGKTGFLLAYSALSLLLLVWLIAAAGAAPFVPLWDQTPALRMVPNLVMPLAIILVCFAIGAPNPLSFGGRTTGFDPAHPGIAGIVRRPLLWALLVWSLAHIAPNGDLAHVLLFGGFAAFSALGMPVFDARIRRRLGAEAWQNLARATSGLPMAALVSGRWHPRLAISPLRAGLSLTAWAAILTLHQWVIGVSPLP